ncbi:MAG TPA: Ig-like domain-containing protein, partial [Candidatus Acidoferrum sp.]|nr:Ig-like domain-containing protein [Candidatus Acidoferrum sp.]
KITVTSTKVASGTNIAFAIAVTASVGANGQVQLFDGSTALGSAVTVSNGSATINNAGLAPGTHSISAHYLGDTYTQASQSGALNVTSTGTTTFVVSATPAASNGTPTVSITIN